MADTTNLYLSKVKVGDKYYYLKDIEARTAAEDAINAVDDLESVITTNISSINDSLGSVTESISSINDNINSINDNISTINSSISSITNNLDNATDSISSLTTDLANVTDRVEAVEGTITSQLTYEIVDSLPATLEENTIYLVPDTADIESGSYVEYLAYKKKDAEDIVAEAIGTTKIDLTNYYTNEETDTAIAEAINTLYADYTPEGNVTFDSTSDTINTITDLGALPTFTQGTAASLGESTKGTFATKSLNATVDADNELLVLAFVTEADSDTYNEFYGEAVTEVGDFTANTPGTYTQGTLPTTEPISVIKDIPNVTFKGTAAKINISSAEPDID